MYLRFYANVEYKDLYKPANVKEVLYIGLIGRGREYQPIWAANTYVRGAVYVVCFDNKVKPNRSRAVKDIYFICG